MFIQFLLTIVLLAALAMTVWRFRQGVIRCREFFSWTLVWIGADVIIWQPDVSSRVAHFVGIGRGVDFILYAAVIVLLCLAFHLHVVQDRLERQMTELVRREALRGETRHLTSSAKDESATG